MNETHWGKDRTVPIISMDTGYICNAIQWHYKKKVYPKLIDHAGRRLSHDEVVTWLNKYPTYDGPSLRRTWRGLITELEERTRHRNTVDIATTDVDFYDARIGEWINIASMNPTVTMYALGSMWKQDMRVHMRGDEVWSALWLRRYELKIASDFFDSDNNVLNKLRRSTHEFSNSLPSDDEYGYGAWRYE
jgi:hypothetical protein